MYKAQHQPSGQEIILLDPRWLAQIEYLRGLDRKDALVCPGCRQPVRVRAGKFKRPHFAHKHRPNCPFERASPRRLQARAVLYAWLTDKFDPVTVEIEKMHPTAQHTHLFDCWVQPAGAETSFAYWIFDRRMPPDQRHQLQSWAAQNEQDVQWLFLIDLLRPDAGWPQSRLHLTTTERGFIRQSALDQAWQTHFEHRGGSLHYLDPDQRAVTTYRNLTRVHKPQLYTGKQLQNQLSRLLISEHTGEFIHPGETARLARAQQQLAAQQHQAAERLRKAEAFFQGVSLSQWVSEPPETPAIPQAFDRQATCRVCGIQTSDWLTYFGETQECLCRNCQDHAEKPA